MEDSAPSLVMNRPVMPSVGGVDSISTLSSSSLPLPPTQPQPPPSISSQSPFLPQPPPLHSSPHIHAHSSHVTPHVGLRGSKSFKPSSRAAAAAATATMTATGGSGSASSTVNTTNPTASGMKEHNENGDHDTTSTLNPSHHDGDGSQPLAPLPPASSSPSLNPTQTSESTIPTEVAPANTSNHTHHVHSNQLPSADVTSSVGGTLPSSSTSNISSVPNDLTPAVAPASASIASSPLVAPSADRPPGVDRVPSNEHLGVGEPPSPSLAVRSSFSLGQYYQAKLAGGTLPVRTTGPPTGTGSGLPNSAIPHRPIPRARVGSPSSPSTNSPLPLSQFVLPGSKPVGVSSPITSSLQLHSHLGLRSSGLGVGVVGGVSSTPNASTSTSVSASGMNTPSGETDIFRDIPIDPTGPSPLAMHFTPSMMALNHGLSPLPSHMYSFANHPSVSQPLTPYGFNSPFSSHFNSPIPSSLMNMHSPLLINSPTTHTHTLSSVTPHDSTGVATSSTTATTTGIVTPNVTPITATTPIQPSIMNEGANGNQTTADGEVSVDDAKHDPSTDAPSNSSSSLVAPNVAAADVTSSSPSLPDAASALVGSSTSPDPSPVSGVSSQSTPGRPMPSLSPTTSAEPSLTSNTNAATALNSASLPLATTMTSHSNGNSANVTPSANVVSSYHHPHGANSYSMYGYGQTPLPMYHHSHPSSSQSSDPNAAMSYYTIPSQSQHQSQAQPQLSPLHHSIMPPSISPSAMALRPPSTDGPIGAPTAQLASSPQPLDPTSTNPSQWSQLQSQLSQMVQSNDALAKQYGGVPSSTNVGGVNPSMPRQGSPPQHPHHLSMSHDPSMSAGGSSYPLTLHPSPSSLIQQNPASRTNGYYQGMTTTNSTTTPSVPGGGGPISMYPPPSTVGVNVGVPSHSPSLNSSDSEYAALQRLQYQLTLQLKQQQEQLHQQALQIQFQQQQHSMYMHQVQRQQQHQQQQQQHPHHPHPHHQSMYGANTLSAAYNHTAYPTAGPSQQHHSSSSMQQHTQQQQQQPPLQVQHPHPHHSPPYSSQQSHQLGPAAVPPALPSFYGAPAPTSAMSLNGRPPPPSRSSYETSSSNMPIGTGPGGSSRHNTGPKHEGGPGATNMIEDARQLTSMTNGQHLPLATSTSTLNIDSYVKYNNELSPPHSSSSPSSSRLDPYGQLHHHSSSSSLQQSHSHHQHQHSPSNDMHLSFYQHPPPLTTSVDSSRPIRPQQLIPAQSSAIDSETAGVSSNKKETAPSVKTKKKRASKAAANGTSSPPVAAPTTAAVTSSKRASGGSKRAAASLSTPVSSTPAPSGSTSSPPSTAPLKLSDPIIINTGSRRLATKFYPCSHPGCSELLKTRFSLKRHMKKHTGEKPHVCPYDECGKSFPEASTLKRHLRIHTGEKPFKCSFHGCQKAFADATNVKRHEMTHTGEKPYRCLMPNCPRSFSRGSSLRQHMMSLHSLSSNDPTLLASVKRGRLMKMKKKRLKANEVLEEEAEKNTGVLAIMAQHGITIGPSLGLSHLTTSSASASASSSKMKSSNVRSTGTAQPNKKSRTSNGQAQAKVRGRGGASTSQPRKTSASSSSGKKRKRNDADDDDDDDEDEDEDDGGDNYERSNNGDTAGGADGAGEINGDEDDDEDEDDIDGAGESSEDPNESDVSDGEDGAEDDEEGEGLHQDDDRDDEDY